MKKHTIRVILLEEGICHQELGEKAQAIEYDHRSLAERGSGSFERCGGSESCGRVVRCVGHEQRTPHQNAWARGNPEGSTIRLRTPVRPPSKHLINCRSDVFGTLHPSFIITY